MSRCKQRQGALNKMYILNKRVRHKKQGKNRKGGQCEGLKVRVVMSVTVNGFCTVNKGM